MIPADDYTEQRRLYDREGRGIWRIIGYCGEPTVTMENLVTKQREHFGVSGATAGTFEPIPGYEWNHSDGTPVKTPSVP